MNTPLANFFVSGTPVPQGQMIPRLRKNGLPFLAPAAGKRWREWRDTVTKAAQETVKEKFPAFSRGYGVCFRFVLPRPRNHYNSKWQIKSSAPVNHLKKPDVDNLCKAVQDSLTRAEVWEDDCEVTSVQATKEYEGIPGGSGVHIFILGLDELCNDTTKPEEATNQLGRPC